MMRTLRDNTAVVLWILVLAFVATIVFSWGMGGFSTVQKDDSSTIARINGQDLAYREYEQLVNRRLQQSAGGERADDAQVAAARRQGWSDLVNLTLEQQLIRELGLGAGDGEVSDHVLHIVPDWARNDTTFLSGGVFDSTKWFDLLGRDNMRGFLMQYESQLREQIPLEKLRARLQASALVSDADLFDDYLQKNQTASGSWLVWPYASFEIDSAELGRDALKAWYDGHREDYRVDERRRVEYVQFKVEPSREDSLDAEDQVAYVKRQLEAGETFEAMARTYSMDPSNADSGGDLGWFGRGKMVPAFEEAAFAAEIGRLVGPVRTRFGLHLIEVLGRETRDDGSGVEQEQVHARHVLIKIEPSTMTYGDLRAKADGVYEDAAAGGDFAVLCAERGLQVQTGKPFTAGSALPGVGRSQRASDLVFAARAGETLAPIYSERGGWFVYHLLEILPEGLEPLDARVADVRQAVVKELQRERALASAAAFLAAHPGLAALDSALAVAPAEFGRLEQPIKINQFVRGSVGRDLAFSSALFATPVGAVRTEAVAGERGAYVVACEARDGVEELQAAFEQDRATRREDAFAQARQSAYGTWSRWMQDRAVVEDNRRLFGFDY